MRQCTILPQGWELKTLFKVKEMVVVTAGEVVFYISFCFLSKIGFHLWPPLMFVISVASEKDKRHLHKN